MFIDPNEFSSLKKILLMGFSGTGKTTAISALAVPDLIPDFPGYKILALDFDGNGKFAEVFVNSLLMRLAKKQIGKEQFDAAFQNLDVEVCRENTGLVQLGKDRRVGVIGAPTAWTKAMAAIDRWEKDFSDKTIFVIDSLTFLATIAAVNYDMYLNGKLNENISGDFRNYMAPQQRVTKFLSLLADCKSHIILTAHQEPMEMKIKNPDLQIEKRDGSKENSEELVEAQMAPVSIGSKGRVHIPAGFNHTLITAMSPTKERRIYTDYADGVSAKTPFFGRAEKSYPLSTGLAQYWMLG